MTALQQQVNFGAGVCRAARRHPDREAIVAADIRLGYDKVALIGQAFAVNMHAIGVTRASIVAVHSRDMIATVGVLMATSLLGARFVLHNPRDPRSDGATVVLYSPEQDRPPVDTAVMIPAHWSPRHTPIPQDTSLFAGYADPEDPWWAMQTSGTTGRAKTLWLSHRVAYDRSLAVRQDFDGDRTRFASLFPCNVRPFIVRAMAALLNGATIVDSMDPAFLSGERVTLISASPRQAVDWLDSHRHPPRFAKIQVSGAPLRLAAADRLLRSFAVVEDVYGSGETNKAFVNRWTDAAGTPTRQGVPQDSVVEICGPDGQPCPPGETGEVRIRNSYMVAGYADAPDAARRAFRNGWFYPGDLGRWQDAGALDIVGRVDQLLNLGGVKVDPLEIEEVLRSVPGVIEAAVFLDPTDPTPPRTMAFLRLAPHHDVADTVKTALDHCEQRLGATKAPGYVYVVPEIPMTNDGVPRRAECARMARTLPRNP